jgi:hypothetical protein
MVDVNVLDDQNDDVIQTCEVFRIDIGPFLELIAQVQEYFNEISVYAKNNLTSIQPLFALKILLIGEQNFEDQQKFVEEMCKFNED